jgi:hypothetical protein
MSGTRRLSGRVRSAPGPAPHSDKPFVTFTDVTADSGLAAFRLHAGAEPPKNWILETVGGGLAAADFDGDGDVDLFFTDGDGVTREGRVAHLEGAGCRLFRNDGGFRFADVTAASGAGLTGYLIAAAAADFDGDGDADLAVVGFDAFHLLRNRGDGTFEEATAAAGLAARPGDMSNGCAWGDFDGDGRLDLFVTNYVDHRAIVATALRDHGGDPRHCRYRGRVVFCGPRGVPPQANRLLFQRDGGRFEDLSATHLTEPARPSFQPLASDFDGDGDLDVYVANDAFENTLLVNDGAGRLTDRGVESGSATDQDFDVQGSMGVAAGDFDLDGRIDVAVSNFAYEYNALYRNRTRPGGAPLFDDQSIATRFAAAPQDRVCWGIGLPDFDLDGLLDAFIAAGHIYPDDETETRGAVRHRQTSQVLRNLGAPGFSWEDVSSRAGPHFADARLWRGAVFPDLDDDGDPDVVLTAQHEAPAVLRNDGGERNAWVRLDLRGRRGTPAGARVVVTLPDGTTRVREVVAGSSLGSSDDPRIVVGWGASDAAAVPKVEIRWPGGKTTTLTDVPARRTTVVREE